MDLNTGSLSKDRSEQEIALSQTNQSLPITCQNASESESGSTVAPTSGADSDAKPAPLEPSTPTQKLDENKIVKRVELDRCNSVAAVEVDPNFCDIQQVEVNSEESKGSNSTVVASSSSSPSATASQCISLSGDEKDAGLSKSKAKSKTNNLLAVSPSKIAKTSKIDEEKGAVVNNNHVKEQRRPSTPVRTSSLSTQSNFVRNSLPSRSVNYGHSKTSAYLDRIRASVTATTTTNTTSSFNQDLQTRNILLASSSTLAPPSSRQDRLRHAATGEPAYLLNCLLEHQHSDKCFVINNVDHVQKTQPFSSHDYHHNHIASSAQVTAPSRQLNALIDPVSNQHLMMNMLHHNENHQGLLQPHLHRQPLANHAHADNAKNQELTEQQIAHFTNLHHQHYYHHLQHMHQLHQLHHQHYLHLHHHRLHHKYQQQQQQNPDESNSATGQQQQTAGAARQQQQQQEAGIISNNIQHSGKCPPLESFYSGGSQFYAPAAVSGQLDQVYANMVTSSRQNQQRTKLVNNNSNSNSNNINQEQAGGLLRSSPSRQHGSVSSRLSPQKASLSNHYTALPQIDEMNGLPTVDANGNLESTKQLQQHKQQLQLQQQQLLLQQQKQQQRNSQVHMSNEEQGHQKHNGSSTVASPSSSSSSPTSSASSNLSPSSASSSSSLNSLSASNTPLNRAAPVRHTTTDLNRRQYSIERELVGPLPMTATLSRVGSCRTASTKLGADLAPNGDVQQVIMCQRKAPIEVLQMGALDKSHHTKLSTRHSKILNGNGTYSTASNTHQQRLHQLSLPPQPTSHQQHTTARLSTSLERETCNLENTKQLANNLANISLNDGLAFSSLQASKSAPIEGNNLANSKMVRHSLANSISSKRQTSSANKLVMPKSSSSRNSPEKDGKKLGTGLGASTANNTKDNGGNKSSSVWFEYGCV